MKVRNGMTFLSYFISNISYTIILPMKRRYFILEHITELLILARPFLTEQIPLTFYLLALTLLLALKYHTEGFTPLTLLVVVLLILTTKAEIYQLHSVHYGLAVIAGLLYFVPLKLYWLPQSPKTVGFQDSYLDENVHYYEFYPLDESKPFEISSMRWNYSKEIPKMIEYRDYSNNFIKKIAHLLLSYADKHQLTIGKGEPLKTDRSIVVSHGKGGTPLFYSSLMMHFAGKGYKVGGVQHSEQMRSRLTTKEEIKKFRESEVKVRAQQMIKAIEKLSNKEIVLMGHSYGSATLLMAYYLLPEDLKVKITHLVLLDPWLFPLSKEVFAQKLPLPVLLLANQDFIHNEDAYVRNNEFVGQHQTLQYVIWQGAHHLHQTDVGFIQGNFLGMVKNSALSKEKLELNIEAISKFLTGEKVEGRFGDKDLGRAYEPSYYHVENLEVW